MNFVSVLFTAPQRIADMLTIPGADPGFQVRGGALKKIAPSGGRREIFFGYFVWKITILRPKIIFLSNFRGGARRVRPLLDRPLNTYINNMLVFFNWILTLDFCWCYLPFSYLFLYLWCLLFLDHPFTRNILWLRYTAFVSWTKQLHFCISNNFLAHNSHKSVK
jgi:hypothetical protein